MSDKDCKNILDLLPRESEILLCKLKTPRSAETDYLANICNKIGIKMSLVNPGFIKTSSTSKNTFPMPFIKPASFAAEKIYKGLVYKKRFEIFFPFLIVIFVKILRILPYKLYFYLWKKIGNF